MPTEGVPYDLSRCDRCARMRQANIRTPTKRQLQNSAQWRKLRAEKIAQHPWCWQCLREDKERVRATEVHHLKPLTDGGQLIVPLNELVSLCRTHHAQATVAEKKQRNLRYPL